MLRDLFFFIWNDDFGTGWILFTIVIFLLCLAWIIFIIARTKALNNNLSKSSWLSIIIALFFMYQIIPETFHIHAWGIDYKNNFDKFQMFENFAIKTSLIPWQKGGFYITMAQISTMNKDRESATVFYDRAYSYIKSYKYPCWGTAFLHYYLIGQYDTAIEMSKDWHRPMTNEYHPMFGIMARCYMMKGDTNKALFFINEEIKTEKTPSPYNLALKAYIEKTKGNTKIANEFYQKALNSSTKYTTKETIKDIYADWYKYESKKQKKYRR